MLSRMMLFLILMLSFLLLLLVRYVCLFIAYGMVIFIPLSTVRRQF